MNDFKRLKERANRYTCETCKGSIIMSHHEIEPDLIAAMNTVAAGLARAFDGFGFVLLVYPHNSGDGWMNYISNSSRDDVIVAMKEFIANCEGRGPDSHGLEGHA